MLEKLSVDFVRKIFHILTNGNAQIKFHTICMQNRDREKAANRPVEFGLKLLGYNVWYRLPGIRNIPVGREIGKTYLTRKYLRLPVEDLSSEILENPSVVCDITDSLFLPVLEKKRFYQQVEHRLSCPGFAKIRFGLENPSMKIDAIYKELSRIFQKQLSPQIELEMAAENFMPNRYIIRLLDIAAYHEITIHFVVDSSYPKEFYSKILKRNHICWDTLMVSCEEKKNKQEIVKGLGLEKYGVVSADFNHFIRPLHKLGGRSIYYRAPMQLMRDVWHPKLSEEFRDQYDAVCGAKVFSGKKRPSFAYELGYLCAGPFLYSLIPFLGEEDTVYYAASDSPFSRLAQADCTTNGYIKLGSPVINLIDTGIDPEGFKNFVQRIQAHNPESRLRIVSLEKTAGINLEPLSCVFTGMDNELTRGILDFCQDFASCTHRSTISVSDGRALYTWGYGNICKLVHSDEGAFHAQATAV